ncbi:MAG: hypothetical protein N2748_02325, partial [candidate division WOR-3 bacterium]|nr:hypothetical protein [candidate division WOR-3 bacterium]
HHYANIYDYKTFPVEQDELADYKDKYQTQLAIYKKAVSKIFSIPQVNSYLIFTANGLIISV